jgi:hypothetical protein
VGTQILPNCFEDLPLLAEGKASNFGNAHGWRLAPIGTVGGQGILWHTFKVWHRLPATRLRLRVKGCRYGNHFESGNYYPDP